MSDSPGGPGDPPRDPKRDPKRRAIALTYEAGKDAAPRVVAAGAGLIADRIMALAKEHGVVVERNPELVEALAQVQLGEAIPAELFPVVAEVLVFVARLNREKGRKDGLMPPGGR